MAGADFAKTVVNQTVYFFIAVYLLLSRGAHAVRTLPALALRAQQAPVDQPNRPDTSLDCESDDDEVHIARASRFSMRVDWRWLWTEIGTILMMLSVSESSLQMFRHSFERAVHVHIAIGFSKGFALMLICLTTMAQMAACVTLMTPLFYLVTGSIAPSMVLAATLWFEALVFGDMNDMATLVRSLSLTGTALMLALCRYDRQARNLMSQLPANGILLNIEAQIRKVCTTAKVGLLLPPVSFLILTYAIFGNPFWRTHGILYEWYRGRFQACVALASVLCLVGGQDTKHNILLGWKLQHFERRIEKATDWMLRRKATVLGRPHEGRKKAL